MELAAAILTNSLVLSVMYILVALGFALLFSIAGILNFAHGALYMIGGYICWAFAVKFGLSPWIAMLLAMIIMGGFGVFLEKFCFRPVWGDLNRTLIMLIAIITALETGAVLVIGGVTKAIPAFAGGVFEMGVVSVSNERAIIFIVGLCLLGVMMWLISKTKPGLQMQAIAQNRQGAALQGVNIYRVASMTVALGCALAALAGSFMGSMYFLDPTMGGVMLLKVVEVVILGGVGSIYGVLLGGLMLGFIDGTLPVFVDAVAANAIGLGIIIVFLLFRPQGFFGRLF